MNKITISHFALLILLGCESKSIKKQSSTEKTDSSVIVVKDSIKKETAVVVPNREETEEEETSRVAKEKHENEMQDYKALGMYDGSFYINTESENVNGQLTLRYLGDKEFSFTLDLTVPDICNGTIKGNIFMDRTQHGFYRDNSCYLHFNFMGNWGDYGVIVEIEQEEKCDKMEGDCIFTGKYVSKSKE